MTLAKKMGTLSLMSCAILACQFSCADEEWINPDWANSAWYIGAGAGKSRVNIDEARLVNSLTADGASSVAIATSERDTAYKFFVGKQLNKYFALEGGYFDLGKFSFNAVTTPLGLLNGEVRIRGLNADVLAQLPVTERVSIYGRLGMNYAKSNARFTGTRLLALTDPNPSQRKLNAKAGLGLEFKLTEALALRTEVERYRVNDAVNNRGDVDFYSANIVYKLGKPARAPRAAYVAPAVVETPAPAPVVVEPPPPPPPKPVPVSEKVTFAAEALFDFDKSVVKADGKAALDDLLNKLQGMNTEVMITVGYTDSVGSEAYNQKLSIRRAEAVKAYLVSKGIDISRVYTEGKGETQPIADNTTAEGRSKNRRVTVEVVGSRATM